MKSMGSGWENLKIQLALKGLIFDQKYSTVKIKVISTKKSVTRLNLLSFISTRHAQKKVIGAVNPALGCL